MLSLLLKRLLQGAISIVGVSVVIFMISRLSGDPTVIMLPLEAPQSVIDELRRTLGLDQPLWKQYLIFAQHAFAGDFGRSYRWEMPALRLILDRLPATIYLAVCALVFSIAVAVPIGVLSAVYRGSWIDKFGRIFAMLGQAMPAFWVGLLLI